MRLDRIVAKNRIIDLKSKDFGNAIEELLRCCPLEDDADRKIRALKKVLRKREDAISSYLGNGIALPHARTRLKKNYILAVGRCAGGLIHNGQHNQELRLVFLLLVSESAPEYLNTLATLARIFQNKPVIDKLIREKTLSNFRDSVKKVLAGEPVKSRYRTTRFNSVILGEAKKIAKGTDCSSILIFGDTFSSPVQPVFSFKDYNTVMVLQSDSEVVYKKDEVDSIITLRSRSESRFSQLRSAVLIGLAAGAICYWGATSLKNKMGYDDSFDVFGVHGIGGIVGALLTGCLAVNLATGDESFTVGSQLWVQVKAVMVTIAWSGVVAYIAMRIAGGLCGGIRSDENDETEGLDVNEHGEEGYNL